MKLLNKWIIFEKIIYFIKLKNNRWLIIKITINNKEENIDLLNDYLFAKLFSEKNCEKETLHLINTITEKNFKHLSYEPNELQGRYKKHKRSVTDVLVMMDEGTIVNIESQIETQKKFHKRSHFYNSKILSIFLNVGEDYGDMPKIIMINILDFNLHENGNYHKTFVLCDKKNKEYILDDILETHYIELPKFRKEVKKGNINLSNPKDRLILLLNKNTPQNLIDKVIKMDKFAKNIYNKTLHVLQDQQEYLSYIRVQQAEQDKKNIVKYAEEKGEQKGLKKGKVEIAIKLKKLDFSIEQIAEITEMPLAEIKKL